MGKDHDADLITLGARSRRASPDPDVSVVRGNRVALVRTEAVSATPPLAFGSAEPALRAGGAFATFEEGPVAPGSPGYGGPTAQDEPREGAG